MEAAREVVLVLIGASFCAGMKRAAYRPTFLAARDTIAKRVRHAGRIFVTIGVSLDWDPEVGICIDVCRARLRTRHRLRLWRAGALACGRARGWPALELDGWKQGTASDPRGRFVNARGSILHSVCSTVN